MKFPFFIASTRKYNRLVTNIVNVTNENQRLKAEKEFLIKKLTDISTIVDGVNPGVRLNAIKEIKDIIDGGPES